MANPGGLLFDKIVKYQQFVDELFEVEMCLEEIYIAHQIQQPIPKLQIRNFRDFLTKSDDQQTRLVTLGTSML